jgi:CDP-diacylglycerol--serine O-phosphatidyltransferase
LTTFNRKILAPAALSAANIAAGFGAMAATADGRFEMAVYLLVLAVFLDMFDGPVARRLHATSTFGQQLDSLSDALSFGATPAFLAYRALLQPLGPVGFLLSLVYLLAAVFRLVRFNLTSDAHQKEERATGVPTPIGAGYVMALVLMRGEIPPLASAAVVLVLAGLMVMKFELPTLKGKSVVTATIAVGVVNYLAVVAWPNWYTVAWWNLWNVVILVAFRRVRGEERRLA